MPPRLRRASEPGCVNAYTGGVHLGLDVKKDG